MTQNNRPARRHPAQALGRGWYGGGRAGRRVGRDTAGASPGRRRGGRGRARGASALIAGGRPAEQPPAQAQITCAESDNLRAVTALTNTLSRRAELAIWLRGITKAITLCSWRFLYLSISCCRGRSR
jgi:hypothetical protein